MSVVRQLNREISDNARRYINVVVGPIVDPTHVMIIVLLIIYWRFLAFPCMYIDANFIVVMLEFFMS